MSAKQAFKRAYRALRGDGKASYVGTSQMMPVAIAVLRNRAERDVLEVVAQRVAYAFAEHSATH